MIDSPRWVKSSYSNSGSCVEWAPGVASATGVVPVRDSKDLTGPVLNVPAAAFTSFVTRIKSNDVSFV